MKKIILFLLLLVSDCFPQLVPQFQHQPPVGYQINLAHPDAQGLISRWLVHEGIGLRLYDLSPYGNDGILTNMDEFDWVVGRDGWALDFDGSDDHISMGNRSILKPARISIIAWVNARNLNFSAGFHVICDFSETGGGSTAGYRIFFDSDDDNWQFRTATSSGMNVGSNETAVENEWLMIAAVYDGINNKISVNAGPQASAAQTGDITYVGSDDFWLGDLANADNVLFRWDGFMSDIIIYDRALSVDEIKSLYINSYAMFEQPPGRILAAVIAAAAVERRRLIKAND